MGYILKPGLAEPKKKGKKPIGLDLDRVIGDFLVEQGIATTEDCCTYTAVPTEIPPTNFTVTVIQ